MSTRTALIVSIALILAAAVLSLAVFSRLPDPMASHWGINDQVNGTISRFWGAFFMPLLALGLLGLFLLLPSIDPLKANIAKFREVFNAFIAVILAFLLYVHVLTIVWNLGYQSFRMSTAVVPGVGLLFIFAGLLMRKAKRNFFIGIRTPWTLSSDRVWDETHRLGAILFILSGFLALAGAFFPGSTAYWFVFVPVLVASLFLVIYSYVLWTREQSGK
jgi:uncharacterized membrane protein